MNYKYFSLINDFVDFSIAIETNLYKKETAKFDLLFMNFQKDQYLSIGNCYYVEEYNSPNNCLTDNFIYINLNNSKWLYYFFIDIDNIMIKHLSPRVICLHGSGVCLDKGAVVFVGKRNIGKSTIIKKLLNVSEFSYLDDDVLMVGGGLVWGPGLPIKSRKPDSVFVMECNDEPRYLSNYLKKINQPQNIISIVYPTYNKLGHNVVETLSAKQNFGHLYENIKHGDLSMSIKTVVEMSLQCRAYRLDYSNDEFLYSSIEKMLL